MTNRCSIPTAYSYFHTFKYFLLYEPLHFDYYFLVINQRPVAKVIKVMDPVHCLVLDKVIKFVSLCKVNTFSSSSRIDNLKALFLCGNNFSAVVLLFLNSWDTVSRRLMVRLGALWWKGFLYI